MPVVDISMYESAATPGKVALQHLANVNVEQRVATAETKAAEAFVSANEARTRVVALSTSLGSPVV